MNIATLEKERQILKQLNDGIIPQIDNFLTEYGELFGARVYDEVPSVDLVRRKLKIGLFGPDEVKPEQDLKNDEIVTHIIRKVAKKKYYGGVYYMNYIPVLHVKASGNSSDVALLPMFRFAITSEKESPINNLFVGADKRFYNGWADFLENNELPHDHICFAPKNGSFDFTNGNLHLDIFHETKYIRNILDPAVAVVGLAGTALLTVALPPVGAALGLATVSASSIYGVGRGISTISDMKKHGESLVSLKVINPILDMSVCLLAIHSAIGVMKASSTLISSSKVFNCLLFTERSLKIGNYSRLYLNIFNILIGAANGKITIVEAACNIIGFALFYYNFDSGLKINTVDDLSDVVSYLPNVLDYRHIQTIVRLSRNVSDIFYLEFPEANSLLKVINSVVQKRSQWKLEEFVSILRRVMNIKWNKLIEEIQKLIKKSKRIFPADQYNDYYARPISITFFIDRSLRKYLQNDDNSNSRDIDDMIDNLTKDIVQLWKKMKPIVFNETKGNNILDDTIIFFFIVKKLENKMGKLNGGKSKFIKAFYEEISNILTTDVEELSNECKQYIENKTLKPIKGIYEDHYTNVSYFSARGYLRSVEKSSDTSFIKVDGKTNIGILVDFSRSKDLINQLARLSM